MTSSLLAAVGLWTGSDRNPYFVCLSLLVADCLLDRDSKC